MARISVWLELLTKACDYMVVCEKYYQKLLSSGNDLEGGIYYIGTVKTSQNMLCRREHGALRPGQRADTQNVQNGAGS